MHSARNLLIAHNYEEDDYESLAADSIDEDHEDSEKWSLLHEVHEAFNQHKCGKARNSRRQKKKKKDSEGRTPTIKRRNTLDAIIFNEMCDKADQDRENEAKEEAVKEGNRKNKRTFKLLRTNERDSKLDIGESSHYEVNKHCCLLPKNIKVETKNRFRCLRSQPVVVEEKKQHILSEISTSTSSIEQQAPSDCFSLKSQSLREREIFHDTFSFLIRLGSTDKDRSCRRQMSQEETRWQNELKDLIWLELQSYRADLTPMAMDEYLCKQREAVGALLDEIMAYRFDPTTTLVPETSDSDSSQIKLSNEANFCGGCLSMYCRDCTRAQSEALKQVENLLTRLEIAEALFPSSQAFSSQYPMYKSPEFTGRVKAMCLWYNMTKHHRLKLIILGRLLTLLDKKKKPDDSSLLDSGLGSRTSDNTSPSDSNNSNASNTSYNLPFKEFSLVQTWNLSSPESSFNVSEDRLERLEFYLTEFDRQVYRKYIEDVLKTRGLRKSLNFLERLHTSVLRKARLALEKSKVLSEENTVLQEEYEGDQELRRYGVWSPEARDLNLPSYRAAFVFLSRVPLDVIHEFLRMRLEQKPEQPSPLSVRQLMRELREGLRIAGIHRERFAEHSQTAAACDGPCTTLFDEDVKEFDKSLKSVFYVYLNYLQQWVEMVHHDSFHKNLIQDEWNFVKSIAEKINNGYEIAGRKFCEIAKIMVMQINEFFIEHPRKLKEIGSIQSNEELSVKFHLMSVGREWQALFDEAREKVVKSVTLAKCLRDDIEKFLTCNEILKESIDSLMLLVMGLKYRITEIINEFQKNVDEIDESKCENDFIPLRIRVREILHHAYRMGFDYYKELCKCVSPYDRHVIVKDLINFAFLWMDFVRNYCERGRGLRPRWANQGLEFLMVVCEPMNTRHLTQEEFDQLKTSMDHCISHVVGSASRRDTSSERDNFRKFSGSRATSPHCRCRTSSISSTNNVQNLLKPTEISSLKQLKPSTSAFLDEIDAVLCDVPEKSLSRCERAALAVKNLEYQVDQKLRSRELIGQVVDRKHVDKIKIKVRRVHFTWQRGIKIGQGRFGKVYTVVNNQTGELLAMKEVQLQPGDYRAIKRVAEELQIFEGIQHKHLVRYYGVEIHREELLIFMEFCAEGTLESLVVGSGNGLPESLLRKYTHQLLLAVSVLHTHGIVHRDIKTANIFLTDEGNCLKLGDFGSAVQIKAHTTMPGELQGFVGTQAYMAPEVFMKSETGGHGRAADIWSIGCCVIEMSSGKRPWAEYDSNYQIMFKVGMGESPQPPKHLSSEGIDFINKCLQNDPRKRPTASILMTHTFARSYEDVNADLTLRPL